MSVSYLNSLVQQNVVNGFSFIGVYDSCLQYAQIQVIINTTTINNDYNIIIEYSNDQTVILYTENVNYCDIINNILYFTPKAKFIKVSLTANSNIDDLSINTMFKVSNVFIATVVSSISNDVLVHGNISATNGDALTVSDGGLNVNILNGEEIIVSGSVSIATSLPTGSNTIGSILSIVNSLPAGTNNIGDVDIASMPSIPTGSNTIGSILSIVNQLPAGTNNIGDVDIASMPSIPTGSNTIGSILSIVNQLPAGTNNIGDVDIVSMPSIPAGSNNIGNILSIVNSLPAGSNNIGDVDIASMPSIPAGTNNIGNILNIVNQLPAGSNNIGDVDIASMPSIPAGTNNIGNILNIVNQLPAGTNNIGNIDVQGIEPQFRFHATPATNTSSVYADGAQGTNVNGGWLYVNTGGSNKINWYVYANSADQAATAKKLSSVVSMYALIYQKPLTVLPEASKNPFIALYTLPEADTTRWYKNRYNFSAYTDQSAVVGLKLLYIGVDNLLIHPEITIRIQLLFDPVNSTNTLAGGANEDLWLGTIGSSSNTSAGDYNFVFSEYGIDFTEEARLPTILPIIGDKVQVSLATNAATESTLSLINGKTPALGQALAALSQPVVLPVSQIDLLKPLTSVGITGAIPAGGNIIGSVNINGPGILLFSPPNTISVSLATVGQWYKLETIGTTTTLQWQTLGVEPVIGRIFKALVVGTLGTGTIVQLLYNENVVVKTSALPNGASTELTLNAINTKTPSLGQKASSDDCQPVVLTTAQVDLLKPLATQPISGSVSVSNFIPLPAVNQIVTTNLTVGNWYKCEAVDTDTLRAVWVSMGAVSAISLAELRPPIGRVFRCLSASSLSASVFSPIIYSENVKVSNFPALQPVSLSNPEIAPIPNTISVNKCKIGFWYKIQQLGTTPNQSWIDLGTEAIVGRVFLCMLMETWTIGGTGEVSILPYFSGRYSQEGNAIFQPNAVLEVDFHSVNPHPFVSSNVGNTSQIVYGQYTKLRNVILQKTDSTITYVYLYCIEGNNPTSEDTPWFRFIVKDTTPFTLYFNQEFVYGISIRATSDLNGTTDPDPNTLFVNITYSQ